MAAQTVEFFAGHVHTYKRVLKNGKKTKIFACTHPHCPTTRPADLLVGKAAICPYCSQEFIITRLKLNKQGLLHCDDCTRKGKKTSKTARLEEELKRILLFGVKNDDKTTEDAEVLPESPADETGGSNS